MSGEDSADIPDPAGGDAPDAEPQQSSNGWASSVPDDAMSPPAEPCECWCMHCRRTFMSTDMWFQRVLNDPAGFKGFWMCPTPNCGGAGFTIDIWPTDPEHPVNKECVFYDDEDLDDDEFNEDEFLDDDDYAGGGDALAGGDSTHADAEWDPQEAKWKELDELIGGEEEDDDLEGEEWKYGLQPGERPPEPDWQMRWEGEDDDEQRGYDEPDRRPREVDWSDREDRRGGDWREDDIPF
jgi:hypothetical protein